MKIKILFTSIFITTVASYPAKSVVIDDEKVSKVLSKEKEILLKPA